MNQSQSIAAISAALVKAQAEFPTVAKTKEVIVQTQKGSYVFKYAPLEDMISTLRPILTKNGLGFTQGGDGDAIVTTLFHESGEWISHRMPLTDTGHPQQYGSLFTYKRRYSLKAALGIETDEDDADRAYTDDGKQKRATPLAGAADGVPQERRGWVERHASTIIDCFNGGVPDEAHKAWKEVKDQGEMLYLWTFLDSKMRRELKRRDKEASDGK